jgi:hypothetical protein
MTATLFNREEQSISADNQVEMLLSTPQPDEKRHENRPSGEGAEMQETPAGGSPNAHPPHPGDPDIGQRDRIGRVNDPDQCDGRAWGRFSLHFVAA